MKTKYAQATTTQYNTNIICIQVQKGKDNKRICLCSRKKQSSPMTKAMGLITHSANSITHTLPEKKSTDESYHSYTDHIIMSR